MSERILNPSERPEEVVAEVVTRHSAQARLRRIVRAVLVGTATAAVGLAGFIARDWWGLRIVHSPEVQAAEVGALSKRLDAHEHMAESKIRDLDETMRSVAELRPEVGAIRRDVGRIEGKVDRIEEKVDNMAATIRLIEERQARAEMAQAQSNQ